jgi:hypothetical protein
LKKAFILIAGLAALCVTFSRAANATYYLAEYGGVLSRMCPPGPKAGCIWCVSTQKCYAVTDCSGGTCTVEYGAQPYRPSPGNNGRPISSMPVLHHPTPTPVTSTPVQGHPVSPPQNNPVILEKSGEGHPGGRH